MNKNQNADARSSIDPNRSFDVIINKKLKRKLRKLNITYDEYNKRKNYNKKIIEINNNLKNLEEKIKKLDLNKKELINNTINTMKENLNKLDSFSNKKELINNTINMFNKNTLIEINNNLKILEKKKQELNLKKEKLTNINRKNKKTDVIIVKRFFKLADKEINRKNQESNKEKINKIRKSKTESNIFFQKEIEDKNVVKRFIELASSNKRIIDKKNIHEIRDSLENIDHEFELIGNIKLNNEKRKTTMRFQNIDDFDTYIEKIDLKYDAGDVIFEGDLYIIEKEFNKVNRSNYGTGSNHLYDIQEYHGKNCYIPTSQNCFLKCINYLTGKDYKNEYFQFINSEGRRKSVMTLARIQPFCKKNNIDIGIYKQNEKRILPRTVTDKSKALFLYKNHFCVIWISNAINFSKAVEEIELNFKTINNKVTDINVNKFTEYKFNPKK